MAETEEIEEIPNNDDKIYQILTGREAAPSRSTLLKELKKKNPAENRPVTPDQAPNIDHEFDALNPGSVRETHHRKT